MADRAFPYEATPVHQPLRRAPTEGRLCLLVIDDELVATFPLPDAGSLVIGRSEEADIHIDAPMLSRRHALLHISSKIRVQDLNSANGTHVHKRRLDPGGSEVLAPGDMFELGRTMCVLQHSHVSVRPRRIWSNEYFSGRVEEQCVRAEASGERFAVVRVQAGNKRDRAAALRRLLLASLQPADIIARDGDDCFQVLLLADRAAHARQVVDSIAAAASSEEQPIRTGLVFCPGDGRTPDALQTKLRCQVSAVARPTKVPLVVESSAMRNLHELVERVAAMPINVLLLGETGVGKEVFAERVHTLSPRVAAPLMRINCAALPPNLLESQLFGHVKGAFTTAHEDRAGLLEIADGGSLFLDEVAEMPLACQAKLLRFLDDRHVRRVGAVDARAVDVRIIAATNRDVEHEVAAGNFRRDLYHRLNGISVVIPCLRERRAEIAPLARAFVNQAGQRFGRPDVTISAAALQRLESYPWPGNVRELRNVIERAVVVCGACIEPGDLFLRDDSRELVVEVQQQEGSDELAAATDERMRELVVEALAACGGNQTQAAKHLGISRGTLIARIEKFNLPRPRAARRRRRTTKRSDSE